MGDSLKSRSDELGVLDSHVENPPLTTKAIKTGWILSGLVGAPGLCEFLEIHTIYNQLYVSYVAREQDLNFHFDVKQPSPNFMACLQSRSETAS